MLLERKLLDLAFGKVKFSVIAAMLLASLIVIALWSVIEHQRLLAWLAGIATVKALHVLYLRGYKRHGHRADIDHGKWKTGLVAGAAAAGLGWGSAVFCFPSSPFNPLTLFGVFVLPSTPFDPVTVLLIFTLAGVTAYSSVAMAFVPLAAIAFFACAWLPLAIWLLSFGEQMYVVMGLIALSYLGVMVMLSRRMHATVRSLISITEENRGLRTAQQENDWRMQRFFESAPGFFYTACMTPDGKSSMPFASAGIVELFDVAASEVAESMAALFAVVRAEDIECVIKEREASRRNLSPFHIEFRINHRIKGERWIELHSLPQREPDGSTNWHGFMQDVTERKRLEESLSAREREFRTLAENFPDVVIRYDLDGRRTYVNRALAELAGIEPDAMLGKFLEDTPLVDPDAYVAELRRVIDTREAALLEVAAREPGGEIFWYQARFVPEFDADNRVCGVLMVAGDITERRRMEQELQRRETGFRTLAENLPVAVIRYDAEQRRRYINPAAERMLHGNMTELLGKVPGDGGVPATPIMIEHYRGKMKEVLVTGESCELEFVLDTLPRDQQEHFEVRFSPERDEDENVRGVLAIWYDITERKRMENEMRQQANFRQTLLDAINEVGLQLMVIEEGRINYASNLKLAREFGYGEEEISAGVPLMDIVHPDDRARVLDYHLRRVAGEASPNSYELGLVTKSGERREYETSVAVLPGTSPLRIISVGKDITERKRMEDDLRLKKSVLDQAHDGVYLIDENARFVYVNDEACRALGYSRNELLDMSVGDIDYARFDNDALAVREQSLKEGAFVFETQHRRRDGSLFPVEIQASTLTYRGKHLGLALARDITERKAIERSLHDSERMLQEAQRIAHVGSWDVDMVNDRLVWSDEIFRIWEIDKTQFKADFAAFLETVHPEDRERVSQAYNEAVINHTLYEVEHRLLFPDGRVKHILERGEPQYDAEGKPVRFIGTSLDITERKRFEQALQERGDLLHAVMESSPEVIVFALDANYRYLSFNGMHKQVMQAIWGKEIAVGMSMLDEVIGSHADRELAKRGFDRALSGESFVEENAYGDEALSREYWQTFWSPIRSSEGEVTGLTCFVLNISERRRMEESLRRSEQLMRTVVDATPDWVFIKDQEHRYRLANKGYADALHIAPEDFIGKDDIDLGFPEELVKGDPEKGIRGFWADDRQVLDSNEMQVYPDDPATIDGEVHTFHTIKVPLRDADGKPWGVLAFARDISERKQFEIQLKEKFERIVELNDLLEENARTLEEHAVELEASQEQLKEALEFSNGVINALPDLLFEMDRDGRYLNVWAQNPELLAAQKRTLLGHTLDEMLAPESAAISLDAIREAEANGVSTGKVIRIDLPQGSRWFELSVSRKADALLSDARFLVLSRDVTERQRTEELLRFVADGEWRRGGESFPTALARHLGKSLDVDYVVIDKVADEPGYVETVARYVKGEIAPNVRYGLRSTPCGEVMAGTHCCHGENIQGRFPESGLLKDMQVESYVGIPLLDIEGAAIGLIAVLDEQPLGDTHFVKSILQMVAPSVAAELVRSRMEHVLRESHESLSEAQRISHVGNWELDLESGKLHWSDEIFRIFEIDPERFDASYDAFLDAIHPDDREAVGRAYETSLETRAPYEIEHRLLFADGRIKFVHERCETHYAADGKPLHSLGTVQDITARKLAEESLRASLEQITWLNRHLEENAHHLEQSAKNLEEQAVELEASQEQLKQTEAWYRSILHSAPDGMLVVDERGLIVQVNARLEAMFGYERGELPGMQIEVLLPQALRVQHENLRSGYFASGADLRPAMTSKTLFGCRKDGSTFPVDVSLSRLPELDGRRSAICASVRDITERQAMEVARETALAEAQRLAQLRSAFMAQMSHELRTPLNGILGYAQNLLQDDTLGEKQVAGLNIIQHSGEHLLSLINGLLDHAAIEANKFELIDGDIELDSFLGAIIGIIRVRAEQKNIAFTCDAGSDLPAIVRGDAQRLRQVLINLLANAVKYTDNGTVTLRASFVAPSRIRFAVQDSGVGIAADQLENIFLPFEQIGETRRRAGGTGLGLAISRKLVRLMGGDIRVESQPGAGSVFSFEIEIGVVQSGRAGLDAAALSERAETRAAQAMPMLPAPPRQELDTLHALALRGSMRDVTRHADKLAEADARYQPFAAQLRRLAQSFQTKALLGLIEQYRNREQEE